MQQRTCLLTNWRRVLTSFFKMILLVFLLAYLNIVKCSSNKLPQLNNCIYYNHLISLLSNGYGSGLLCKQVYYCPLLGARENYPLIDIVLCVLLTNTFLLKICPHCLDYQWSFVKVYDENKYLKIRLNICTPIAALCWKWGAFEFVGKHKLKWNKATGIVYELYVLWA